MAAPLNNTVREEALSALMMLGFAKPASEKAIDNAVKVGGQELSVEQMIKIALKNL
ncbi:Holliday junction DNA helicase RuvA [compost metagenome]